MGLPAQTNPSRGEQQQSSQDNRNVLFFLLDSFFCEEIEEGRFGEKAALAKMNSHVPGFIGSWEVFSVGDRRLQHHRGASQSSP